MLAPTDPREAYRRSAFDARVHGGDSAALVQLCLVLAIAGLGTSSLAHERNALGLRSQGLTRALTAITALDMGVDRNAPLAAALLQVYGAARREVLRCVTDFQPERLQAVRSDFVDIEGALRKTA
jgi:flagellar protein FliS